MNTKIFTNKNLIRVLFWYRIIISLIAFYGISRITRLGDVGQFLNADPLNLISIHGLGVLTGKTYLAQFLIGSVNKVLVFGVLTNIFFCILAYCGIKLFLDSIPDKKNKNYKILIFLCYLPSFTVWSSVAGKEAIVVFAMGIICREIVRFFCGNRFRINFLTLLSFYFICVMKPQYLPAVLQLVLYIKLREKLKLSVKSELIIMLSVITVNLIIIYLFRYQLDDYVMDFQSRFREDARSTRALFFIERFDFFRKMPYLMPLALWGPTITETKISILHLMSFAESCMFFSVLVYFLKNMIAIRIKNFISIYQWLFLFLNTTGWLMLAQYIQGINNPGSAIRYRTNLYLLLITLVYSITFTNFNKEKI